MKKYFFIWARNFSREGVSLIYFTREITKLLRQRSIINMNKDVRVLQDGGGNQKTQRAYYFKHRERMILTPGYFVQKFRQL